MEQSNPGNHWSTKLGLLSGPIMILLGLLAVSFSQKNHTMAYVLIAAGVIRLALSAFLYFKNKV
jgi:hypothetical protein